MWKILETDGQVVEASFDPYGNNVEHFRLNDAPSELDVAYEVLRNDMHSMHVISIEEAHEWIQEYSFGFTGHQSAEVRRAIKNELASLGFYLEH